MEKKKSSLSWNIFKKKPTNSQFNHTPIKTKFSLSRISGHTKINSAPNLSNVKRAESLNIIRKSDSLKSTPTSEPSEKLSNLAEQTEENFDLETKKNKRTRDASATIIIRELPKDEQDDFNDLKDLLE